MADHRTSLAFDVAGSAEFIAHLKGMVDMADAAFELADEAEMERVASAAARWARTALGAEVGFDDADIRAARDAAEEACGGPNVSIAFLDGPGARVFGDDTTPAAVAACLARSLARHGAPGQSVGFAYANRVEPAGRGPHGGGAMFVTAGGVEEMDLHAWLAERRPPAERPSADAPRPR